MKEKLRYFFTRLLVLYVALHILDVSVDIDHIALKFTWVDAESIDDTDSVTEFIVELITGDSNTLAESSTDDQNPIQKVIYKYVPFVSIVSERQIHDLAPQFQQTKSVEAGISDTNLRQEDFSSLIYSPPDLTNSPV